MYNTESRHENIEEVTTILDVIFGVIIAMSMFMCFFALISSTSANIMDQNKEIAVLRALGYKKQQIKKLYFYETFVLVFSSSILGILIGTAVGWTMTLQQAEFNSVPILFYFPYKHMAVTTILSVGWAYLATVSPVGYILDKEIAQIFRMG